MVTLNTLIEELQELQAVGHGNKYVFYRHSTLGGCGPLGPIILSDEVEESGPFDLEEGEQYISIYAGN